MMRGSGCDGLRSGKGTLAGGDVVGREGAVSDFEVVYGVTSLEVRWISQSVIKEPYIVSVSGR